MFWKEARLDDGKLSTSDEDEAPHGAEGDKEEKEKKRGKGSRATTGSMEGGNHPLLARLICDKL
ncbi:hypothetical protein LZ31DRAFT_558340 [Colletotrichum somersetense]|nr:hypothetical protein LZ31DRAFT_558340 [Colletotrichum somersetense]